MTDGDADTGTQDGGIVRRERYAAEGTTTGAISTADDERHGRDGRSDWLLVTDVDDTLLGDDEAFRDFTAAVSEIPLIVVLNSSRPIASIQRTIDALDTTWRPYGIVGALGTEIDLPGVSPTGWWVPFVGFDRTRVDDVMTALGCRPHDPEYQTLLKASYEVPPSLREEAHASIRATGVPARVILSGETNFDVIPQSAGKGPATTRVAAVLGVPRHRTLVAGDSRNDLDMLRAARAIVVANGSPDLRTLLDDDDTYRARARHAAGVLEGLRHYGVPVTEGVPV